MKPPTQRPIIGPAKAARTLFQTARGLRWLWLLLAFALVVQGSINPASASSAKVTRNSKPWIGTWAAAAQPFFPRGLETFRNQSLRLIVHTSAGGTKVRVRISIRMATIHC